MLSDIEIAKNCKMKDIGEIAAKLGLSEENIERYGKYKAKISAEHTKKQGKLILVTAINPTASGEGKTTVSIGLADGMARLGKKVCLALREPSLGPVFGIKGGAAGGGYAQVVPMEEINLHFTGDLHAITAANNLLCAMLDNHIFRGNELDIDPEKIYFRRCLDMNDRALRNVTIGQRGEGVEREEHFRDHGRVSEIMAILCLATSLQDLQRRIGNIIVGENRRGEYVFARDLKAEGAMTVAPEGRRQAQPRADAGGHARHRARRAVREHRARLQQHSWPPIRRSFAGRLGGDRSGIRRRPGRGKIPGHQVPRGGDPARLRRGGGDGEGAQTARRGGQGEPLRRKTSPRIGKGDAQPVQAHRKYAKRLPKARRRGDEPLRERHARGDRGW